MAPRLYCPAGLASRASGRSLAVAVTVLAGLLTALALTVGVRGALIALVCAWAAWMAVMPVAVIAAARRNRA
jgi:hypothetical protein